MTGVRTEFTDQTMSQIPIGFPLVDEKDEGFEGLPCSKLTVRPWQIGVERFVSSKNW